VSNLLLSKSKADLCHIYGIAKIMVLLSPLCFYAEILGFACPNSQSRLLYFTISKEEKIKFKQRRK